MNDETLVKTFGIMLPDNILATIHLDHGMPWRDMRELKVTESNLLRHFGYFLVETRTVQEFQNKCPEAPIAFKGHWVRFCL